MMGLAGCLSFAPFLGFSTTPDTASVVNGAILIVVGKRICVSIFLVVGLPFWSLCSNRFGTKD